MWKYILFFCLGVFVMLFLGVKTSKKLKGLCSVGYVFINLVVIFLHDCFNILLSKEIVKIDDKWVMMLQSLGFLVLLKMSNDFYRMFIERVWKNRIHDIELFDNSYDEWRENAVGILLIMTAINDFVLGILFENADYYTQAMFILVIFIGFFISLRSIVGGNTLKDVLLNTQHWKKIGEVIWNKWIKLEKYVIVICAIFFVLADYFLCSKRSIALNLQLKDIGLMLLAFCLGVILIIVVNIIRNKPGARLRTCTVDYLDKKKNQYIEVAMEVRNVIKQTGLEDDEGGFELAKIWILNNESLPIIKSFIDAGREILSHLQNWIPVIVAFALGILSESVSEDFKTIFGPDFWIILSVILGVGFLFELMIKQLSSKQDKYPVQILRKMDYIQYRSLIGSCNSDSEKLDK